jgi:hypothetical protein
MVLWKKQTFGDSFFPYQKYPQGQQIHVSTNEIDIFRFQIAQSQLHH